MKILIVEDEPKVAGLLAAHFTGRGHQVWTSETGQGALALVDQHQPHAILLDLWLKGKMNGVEVLKEVKRTRPETTVVVVTGLEESSFNELLRLGALAVLKKPIRLDELDQLLQQVREQPT
ncbi:MAG: response regulator [Candidatus Omnitrophica bacterium]|nr:response regulator [Candidatus Omnitrophota bacterium]